MKSIRSRLQIVLLTVMTLVLAAGGAAIYAVARTALTAQLDAALADQARTLASLVTFESNELLFDEGDAAHEAFEHSSYEIRTVSGELLVRRAAPGLSQMPFQAPPEGRPVHADWLVKEGVPGRAVWLTFLPRTEIDAESEGSDADHEQGLTPAEVAPERLVVTLLADRSPVDRPARALLAAILGVGIAVELAVCLVVTFGVGWGLRPVTRLSQQLSTISGQAASGPLDCAGAPAELMPLCTELNRMLERVQQTIARERSFADAAAHELRTPLAELRAAAEVAMRWPNAKPAEKALKEILEIGAELERLVESLLLVSRAQHAVDDDRPEPMANLRSIVDSILMQSQEAIRRKQLRIEVQWPPELSLHSSPQAWEIILRNLLDNAIEHTPAQGFITLRLGDGADDQAVLLVENGPVELKHEEVNSLFVPFWRREAARSHRRHVGLGLTIVQQLAVAFGAQVSARLIPEGLRITVCCPSPIS